MRLSQRLFRTSERQARLGRYDVAAWYWAQRTQVLASGDDPEHPPLRKVIERYQSKVGFVQKTPTTPVAPNLAQGGETL